MAYFGNKRTEPRFPSVGIGLIYSPTGHGPVNELGKVMFEVKLADISLSGMSFDVDRELEVGSGLTVLIDSSDEKNELLEMQVKWCRRIDHNRYRVGAEIKNLNVLAFDEGMVSEHQNVQTGDRVPVTINYYCPACGNKVHLDYVGQLPVPKIGEIMPLYNCIECGSTRTISSVLSYNRNRMPGSKRT